MLERTGPLGPGRFSVRGEAGEFVDRLPPSIQLSAERAEFYLCLSRAFRPPRTDADARAVLDLLPGDLRILNAALRYPIGAELDGLDKAAIGPKNAEPFRLAYARLFLSPPTPAPLNAGVYLDGGIMGRSTLMMEEWYRRHGLARAEGFGDLPDHISMLLEFLALLWTKAARGEGPSEEAVSWSVNCLRSWLPDLAARVAAVTGSENLPAVHLHLIRIVAKAVSHDIALAEGTSVGGSDN